MDHLSELIEDPFGNYLIQNVLKLEKVEYNRRIFGEIAKDFIRLSQMKFSSNVIEKCIESQLESADTNHLSSLYQDQTFLLDQFFLGTLPHDDIQIIQ